MLHKTTPLKILFLLILSAISLYSQSATLPKLSEQALVSVVTCSATPGYEGGFGHCSLRVQDAGQHIDVVFNFGSYSERQSFFAYKIFLGTVISYLGGESFKEFADRYKSNGRGINEYYLNLHPQQKQSLWEELNRILISGDRFYKFKVPTDNCSTQLRDVLFKQCNWDKETFDSRPVQQTYRDVEHADPLENYWLHLLFNLVNGPKADRTISLYQAAFYPDGLIALLKEVHQDNQPVLMVSHKVFSPTVFKGEPDKAVHICLFSFLLLTAIILTYLQLKKGKQFLWFDRCLLFISGILGCFLLSLLLCSEIETLNSNYNILWALPTNLALAFCLRKKMTAKWIKVWIGLTCLSIILFPIAAAIGGHVIQTEVYLFAGTLLIRMLPYLNRISTLY